MQKYKRFAKIIAGFMAILFIASEVFMSQTGSVTARAETPASVEKLSSGANFDVFIDADNNVCIVTNDQIRKSTTYYRTIGFSISRGQFNPSAKKLANGASTEYFTLPIDRSLYVDTYSLGSREINIFKYPFSLLLGKMSAAWQQEIQDAQEKGITAYIRFDSIMVIMEGETQLSHRYINDPRVGPYDDEARDKNPKELQRARGWAAGSKTGIKTHYHRWLPIAASTIEEPPKFTDWHVTKQKKDGPGSSDTSSLTYYGDYTGDPWYAGGNANLDGYNAALGIPSTKTVTGYAESSPWFGNVDVWARLVTHQYEKRDTWTWDVGKGSATYETPKGEEDAKKALKSIRLVCCYGFLVI